MALKKCRECGKEVSSRAIKCPSCGAPNRIGCGGWFVGVFFGVIGGLIVAIAAYYMIFKVFFLKN